MRNITKQYLKQYPTPTPTPVPTSGGGFGISGFNYPRAWIKSLFGLFIGFLFWFIFDSLFLGLMSIAFFFFIPMRVARGGVDINKIIFGSLMLILLFLAFYNGSTVLGLNALGIGGIGLETGMVFGAFANILTGILFACAIALVLTSFLGVRRLPGILTVIIILIIIAGMILGQYRIWEWNTSAIIFLGVWVMSFLGGLAADLQSRQTIGIVIIFISFIIFATGVGGQAVGSAFFGDWWPQVHEFFAAIFGPIGDAFSQLGNMFGDAWFMLTDPVGFATQLLNGSYTTNPTGPTGAYGVEITSYDITEVYVTQPYMVTVIMKNQGSQNAENIRLSLCSGLDDLTISTDGLNLNPAVGAEDYELGTYKNPLTKHPTTNGCWIMKTGQSIESSLTQQMVTQVLFSSQNGITCKTVMENELRQRYIPVIANVTYEYEVHSTLQMEFMTLDEWSAQSQAGTLTSQKVESQMTTSPAKLSIGTVNQPIIAVQTPFYIGLKLQSAQGDKSAINWANVELRYPKDFGVPTVCTGTKEGPTPDGDSYVIRWEHNAQDENKRRSQTSLFYCNFNVLPVDKLTGPTKTYVITARADYEFSRWSSKNTLIEFGGVRCCEKPGEESDCGEGMICGDNYICGGGVSLAGDTVVLSEMSGYALTQQQVSGMLASHPEMSGLAITFYTKGQANDVDPAFAIAVAAHESGWGTSALVNNCNNLFGIKETSRPCTSDPNFQEYDSLEESIEAFYTLIKGSLYIGAGKKTPAEIGAVYCPEQPACSTWISDVVSIRNQVQTFSP